MGQQITQDMKVNINGEIDMVMQRGRVIVKENDFVGEKGAGQFIHRHTLKAEDIN